MSFDSEGFQSYWVGGLVVVLCGSLSYLTTQQIANLLQFVFAVMVGRFSSLPRCWLVSVIALGNNS